MFSTLTFLLHYAMTPHIPSLPLDVFTVKLRGWRFLSQEVTDLFHREILAWIGNTNPVVVEFADQGFGFEGAHRICRLTQLMIFVT